MTNKDEEDVTSSPDGLLVVSNHDEDDDNISIISFGNSSFGSVSSFYDYGDDHVDCDNQDDCDNPWRWNHPSAKRLSSLESPAKPERRSSTNSTLPLYQDANQDAKEGTAAGYAGYEELGYEELGYGQLSYGGQRC